MPFSDVGSKRLKAERVFMCLLIRSDHKGCIDQDCDNDTDQLDDDCFKTTRWDKGIDQWWQGKGNGDKGTSREADIGQEVTNDGRDNRCEDKGNGENRVQNQGQAENQGFIDIKEGWNGWEATNRPIVCAFTEEEDGDQETDRTAWATNRGIGIPESIGEDIR